MSQLKLNLYYVSYLDILHKIVVNSMSKKKEKGKKECEEINRIKLILVEKKMAAK